MATLPKALSGFVFFVAALCTYGNPTTQQEREHLVAHLEMTQAWLTDEVSPLSAALLNFRPAPDRWAVVEVVQHLVVAEPNYWKLLQDALKQPPKKLSEQATDADVLWYGIDRIRQSQRPAYRRGASDESFPRHACAALAMARSSKEDLRGHAVPDWGVDAYQCLLEISTHAQRHILQIREIKASAGFPKK